jgi:hypothetical protein
MAVTNTQFANNTYKVTISNELTGSNNVIAGVNTAITTLGWTLYDAIDQTTYSPMATRVYRAPNVDGVTYKYAILRFDTIRLKLNLSCAEDFNVTSHIATNESWHADGCFYHGYDLRNGFFIINATERHLLLQSYILNEPGHWAGIFETERIAAEDISSNTAPCFFYTNSLMLGTPWGIDNARFSNTSMVMMAFPRTPDGLVNEYAAGVYAPTTSRGMWPPYYPSGNTGNVGMNSVFSTANTDFNNLHLGSWWLNIGSGAINVNSSAAISTQGGTWGWDGSEIPMSPISVDAIRKHMPFGRVYDMGITKPIGGQLDTTYFTANTNGGWPESYASGTSNTEFLLMPLNGGLEQYYSNNYASIGIMPPPATVANAGIKVSWSNNSNVVYSTLAPVGTNIWAAANNGIWVWNQVAGTNTTANLVWFNSNGVLDLMFDGKRSIYATTNTGLIQIDTETFATNTITSLSILDQGGCSYLNMDNEFIYAVNRTANTRPACYMIYRSNNTVAANVIQLASGVSLNVASGWNTPMPDYQGFVYLSNSPGTTASQQKRMLVANVQGANSTATGSNPGISNTTQYWYTTAAHDARNEVDNIWIEYNSNRVYHFQTTSGSGFVQEYDAATKNFTLIANTAQLGIGFFVATGGSNSSLTYLHTTGTSPAGDFRGDLNIIQHRGQFHVQGKKPGSSYQTNPGGYVTRFVLHHPFPNPSNTNKVQGNISRTYEAGNVASAAVGLGSSDLKFNCNYWATNGIRIFHNHHLGNTENRIQVLANHFTTHPFGGYPTSRLLIKA